MAAQLSSLEDSEQRQAAERTQRSTSLREQSVERAKAVEAMRQEAAAARQLALSRREASTKKLLARHPAVPRAGEILPSPFTAGARPAGGETYSQSPALGVGMRFRQNKMLSNQKNPVMSFRLACGRHAALGKAAIQKEPLDLAL